MSKKIYIGNMNYNTTEDELGELFGQYGTVLSINIITDKFSGRPKGFAFVEMEEADAADAAISSLNEKEFAGRTMKVSEAISRQTTRNYN